MNTDLLVLAEGVTADARGALTLVGVNQRAIVAASMPFSVKQKVVISLTTRRRGQTGTYSKSFLPGICPSGLPTRPASPSSRSARASRCRKTTRRRTCRRSRTSSQTS
jgi:hypothetical protein